VLTINVAVLLAVIVILRLRRRTEARRFCAAESGPARRAFDQVGLRNLVFQTVPGAAAADGRTAAAAEYGQARSARLCRSSRTRLSRSGALSQRAWEPRWSFSTHSTSCSVSATGRRWPSLSTGLSPRTPRFPDTVQCKTAHALAYAAAGHRYAHRLNAPRRPAWQTGQALGTTKAVRLGDREVTQRALSNATLRTVTRFCHTADEAITPHHVPRLRGLDDTDLHAQLAAHIMPFARKAWDDLQHPAEDDGAVRFDHDHYLKIWALTRPRIEADFLLLDEAQDTNPVVEQIVLNQRDHAQLVMVGDSAQAIYHWRGAKDIMTGFDGTRLALSQSFLRRPRPRRPGPPAAGQPRRHPRHRRHPRRHHPPRPRTARTRHRLHRPQGQRTRMASRPHRR
jgi:hypothetical protein